MSDPRPPAFALRFLEWVCPRELYEGIEGDLLEQFDNDLRIASSSQSVNNVVHRKARIKFVWNVIRFVRAEIILRNKLTNPLNGTAMLGNYFKTASRNILKRKMYSFINAFGLSVGIAFCTLIYLFVQDEKSF